MNPNLFEEIKKHKEEVINCIDKITEYNFLNPVFCKIYPQNGGKTALNILKIKLVFHKKTSE